MSHSLLHIISCLTVCHSSHIVSHCYISYPVSLSAIHLTLSHSLLHIPVSQSVTHHTMFDSLPCILSCLTFCHTSHQASKSVIGNMTLHLTVCHTSYIICQSVIHHLKFQWSYTSHHLTAYHRVSKCVKHRIVSQCVSWERGVGGWKGCTKGSNSLLHTGSISTS